MKKVLKSTRDRWCINLEYAEKVAFLRAEDDRERAWIFCATQRSSAFPKKLDLKQVLFEMAVPRSPISVRGRAEERFGISPCLETLMICYDVVQRKCPPPTVPVPA
jgi:hypothetical protein